MIESKIVKGTLDEVCQQCSQCYEGVCRAYCVPHSKEERHARTADGHGLECDSFAMRTVRRHRGLQYHTVATR